MSELVIILIVISVISSLVKQARQSQAKGSQKTGSPMHGPGRPVAPMPWQPPMTPPPVATPMVPEAQETKSKPVFPTLSTFSSLSRDREGMDGSLGSAYSSPEGTFLPMEGVDPCHDGMELYSPRAQLEKEAWRNPNAQVKENTEDILQFTGQEMVRAVIMSEVLGKPGGRRCRK